MCMRMPACFNLYPAWYSLSLQICDLVSVINYRKSSAIIISIFFSAPLSVSLPASIPITCLKYFCFVPHFLNISLCYFFILSNICLSFWKGFISLSHLFLSCVESTEEIIKAILCYCIFHF